MTSCIHNLDISEPLLYVLGVINIIQSFASTCGNLLVFVSVILNKRLQTRSNAFLLSLASSDFLVGVLLEPLFIMQLFSQDYRDNCNFNQIRRYLSTLFMGAASSSIAVISYDRWVHLSRTTQYEEYTPKKKVTILIVTVWLLPLLVALIRFVGEAAYSAVIIIYMLLLLSLMIACYVLIIKIVFSREKALQNSSELQLRRREMTNHIRVGKAVTFIIICFLATFLPITVYHGLLAISGLSPELIRMSNSTKETCYAVLMTLGFTNSAINPVIYYFRIPEFTLGIKRLFASCCCNRFLSAQQNER